ncbi:uncharacterized protein N7482_007646 [Penicillium canariense]|uniref:Zn(2)-C6 fungal-type domain-containing protein n=1 Tax=Penicillium canariense TaxID=189055 RepID=A0A9W9HX58_9EURO|nr:uncharacterized protein N7482_007646 [Penicillium canariense]KAJ5160642.1 hypothetical protein N7482_007646 [Penicillium canariense]
MTAVAAAPMMSNHDSGTEPGTDHRGSECGAEHADEPWGEDRRGRGRGSLGGNELADPSREMLGARGDLHRDDSQRSSPSGANTHKRKRSESREQDSRQPSEPGYHHHASRGSISHPGEPLPPLQANGTGSGSVSSEMDSINPVATSGHRSDTNEASQPPSNGPWPDYDTHLISQAQRAQQMDASDAHLADALQREAQDQETPRNGANRPVPPAPNMQPASSPTYVSDRSAGAVQVAPKRKRVFSNRTKTGCMTCRRRKKKCDEQHPACNNCIRGGFLCEGYTSRSTWQKPSTTKAPVPLQSKEGYPDMSGQYAETAAHHDRPPSGLPDHMESRKMRPLVVDDNERITQPYTTSPSNNTTPNHASSWSKRTWSGSGHPTYVPPDHLAKPDYREVAPIHELPPRESHPKPDYPVVPPIRELSHGPPPKPNMPLFHSAVEQRPMPPAPAPVSAIDTSSPQAQARMALSIEHQLSGRAINVEETEKDKMIRGELYRPFDVQLVEERGRCKRALWRFNNACNPHYGLSSKEQNRLLKELLVPPSGSVVNSPSGVAGSRSSGAIGQGAVVESPFHCHYGYNIQIGEDVMIHQNCLFVDDCGISIGAHSWIGPNVTLLSSMAHSSMQERKGSQSRYQGRPVIVDEDCYLGAGCTIYPGVHLYRGAYVAPGEVVKTDIVAYGFQGYKPSYM